MQKNETITLNICLTDIPKKGRIMGKNGKWYTNVSVVSRKEPDRFENDVTVYLSQSKDERKAKADKVYVGVGKTLVFNSKDQAGSRSAADPLDDLPF